MRFWTRDSSVLLGGFTITVMLVLYFWWPLAAGVLRGINRDGQWWLRLDWLLIGIFTFMTVVILAKADIKRDTLPIFVGTIGGLIIEAWGTQTGLWHYYTAERPPLWIIPAWPIANLCIDRMTRAANHLFSKYTLIKTDSLIFKAGYFVVFIVFMALMLPFTAPTFDKSFTVFSLILCLAIILTPTDYKYATLTFIAGSGLGYFLELWGTGRHCWTYYTLETPPLFAVLAHGMAAVAFWRASLLLKNFVSATNNFYKKTILKIT